MLSRRTRARLDLLGSVIVLITLLVLRREARKHVRAGPGRRGTDSHETGDAGVGDRESDADACAIDGACPAADSAGREAFRAGLAEGFESEDVTEPLALRWVIVGAAMAVGYRFLYDRDAFSLRRSRLRRLVVEALLSLWAWRFDDHAHSTAVGRAAGAIVYRTKYGLLEEPPGA